MFTHAIIQSKIFEGNTEYESVHADSEAGQ